MNPPFKNEKKLYHSKRECPSIQINQKYKRLRLNE